MSDLELLFLILALIYGWECACWLPRGSVAFRNWFGRRWRLVNPGMLLGNQNGGFVFAHPVPPLGTILTASQFPMSLSPEAVLVHVAPGGHIGARDGAGGRLLHFKDIHSVEVAGKKVRVNGDLFLKAPSSLYAAYVAGHLRRLQAVPRNTRQSGLEKIVRDSLDTEALERRWQNFQKETANLRLLVNFLFGYLFVLAPILIWTFGLRQCWLALLVGLIVLTASAAALFRRAHKLLYPDAEDERFTHFITILLSPATTMRALDVLSRPLLETFHPLALAKVFCQKEQFYSFAGKVLLDIRHPAASAFLQDNPLAQSVESFSRAIRENAVEGFLKRNGINPEALVLPPAPTDQTCRSYCPRCLAQFTMNEGSCADCGGLQLVAFSIASGERKR
jgi:hypothetical protein